jgi:hypothetical protein
MWQRDKLIVGKLLIGLTSFFELFSKLFLSIRVKSKEV